MLLDLVYFQRREWITYLAWLALFAFSFFTDFYINRYGVPDFSWLIYGSWTRRRKSKIF
jgi:hypothetical protein